MYSSQVVLVSGGGGVCRQQAMALLEGGARVCMVGKHVEGVAAPAGSLLVLSGVDMRDLAQVRRAVLRAEAHFGHLDVAVAGSASNHLHDYGHIDGTAAGWATVVACDAAATLNLAVAVRARVRVLAVVDPAVHAYPVAFASRASAPPLAAVRAAAGTPVVLLGGSHKHIVRATVLLVAPASHL